MIADIGVPMFLTGGASAGFAILWVNQAFVRHTGFPPYEVLGRTPRLVPAIFDNRADADRYRLAIEAGEEIHGTVPTRRRDGTAVWTQLTLSPLRDDAGTVTHWVGLRVDVSEHLERFTAQRESLAVERQERMVLDIITRTSDLLTDLSQGDSLAEISALLIGRVVDWCGFYLHDDLLRYAESLDGAPAFGARARQGPHLAAPWPGSAVAPDDVPALDPVQELLDGAGDGPLVFKLDGDYPVWSAAHWLRRDLEERLGGRLRRATVTLHVIPGRRRALGLLVGVLEHRRASLGAEAPSRVPANRADTLLGVVARRAGAAIDNARLYAREHSLAETLQRAMLPEQADIAGLDVWTYYAPNSEHAQVGGDWYDVLDIGPGTVAVVIGDVVGHDVEAAAAMGQLRSVVRSYAYELTDPGPVLERVDQLVTGMRIPRSASMVYAALIRGESAPAAGLGGDAGEAGGAPAAEAWALEYSRAGHLPPLLLRAGTVRQLNEAGGALVGFGRRARATGRVALEPGDALVFYTDGLIERRDRALRVGVDELIEVAGRITAVDAAGVGEELLGRLADAPEDDVAVVVVRVPDPATDRAARVPSPRSRRWLLPSEPSSIGRARHAVLRTCETWGLAEGANAELVVSELVANGVLHGWGHLALRLFNTGDGLRIEVEDANPAPPVTTDGHPNRVGGFGMQIVERLAEWGWRPAGSGKLVWAKLRAVQPPRRTDGRRRVVPPPADGG